MSLITPKAQESQINWKLISIVTPTYNEAENVDRLYERICAATKSQDKYKFEIIFIDNKSTDETVKKVKRLATIDQSVKLIVNTRNFGHIRSPYYGILQAHGQAVIYLASDLQDPPELIGRFISEWEQGYKVVCAVKPTSQNTWLMHKIRRLYYRVLSAISETKLTRDTTGFGLYDQTVVNQLRQVGDPYPYLRGLIDELGYEIKTIDFEQPRRLKGNTKNNIYSLYDIAMLAFVSHSKIPLRLAAILGFGVGFTSIIFGIYFITRKLLSWDSFQLGVAPMLVGMFFLGGIQLIFLGIVGEYVGVILQYVRKRPIVVEEERINF